MGVLKLYINKILHLFEVRKVNVKKKIVFLTFDDGPEGEITDWILDILKKHDAKATFFCKGVNATKNQIQLKRIVDEGHALGNHTNNHIKSFDVDTDVYVKDVKDADAVLHSHLFRPPWGALTLSSFLQLYRKYRIIYWSLVSGDTLLQDLDIRTNMERLYRSTKPGDIVLFHSCVRHEKETRMILPLYLEWLSNNGFISQKID